MGRHQVCDIYFILCFFHAAIFIIVFNILVRKSSQEMTYVLLLSPMSSYPCSPVHLSFSSNEAWLITATKVVLPVVFSVVTESSTFSRVFSRPLYLSLHFTCHTQLSQRRRHWGHQPQPACRVAQHLTWCTTFFSLMASCWSSVACVGLPFSSGKVVLLARVFLPSACHTAVSV